jgi:death-on-curing family protein
MIRDIAGNHMFENGNKRTTSEVVDLLIERNKIASGATAEDIQRAIMDAAKGKTSSVEEIRKAIRGY